MVRAPPKYRGIFSESGDFNLYSITHTPKVDVGGLFTFS